MLSRIPFAFAALVLFCMPSPAADATLAKEALAAAKAIKAGHHDEALAALDTLIKRYPRSPDLDLLYWLTCKAYSGKANYSAAISYCSAAIMRNPRNANFYVDRGRAYVGRGDSDAARADLEAAVAKGAARADVHGLLAKLCLDGGDTACAGSEAAKALKLNAREENARAVRVALRKIPPAETYPAVRPMPRVPPAKPSVKVASAKPAPKPAAAVSQPAPAAPPAETRPQPRREALPARPVPSAPAATAPAPSVPTAHATDNPIYPAPAEPQGAAEPAPPDAPAWWRNTPPVPAYGDRSARPRRTFAIDCARTTIPAERILCTDASLHRQEIDMQRLVRRVMAVAADQEAVEDAQSEWEGTIRNACRSRACLRDVYADRRLELLLWLDD